ncbi:MAG: antirestriction protein ArdA [Ruminococcus sp.]|nr:antirestriction protein ArdA [Ruminococcus sp.]
MINITVQYNDRLRSIHFPCSEKELKFALVGIHAMNDNPSELFVTAVKYPEELSFLKDHFVNLDELNYLAKRFDSFCESEEEQYFEAMKHEAFTELPDLINLTFNLNRYTLIQDISDMGKIGREYLMNRDGCIPAHDEDDPKYAEIGRKMMLSGEGIFTDHGLLFVNDEIPFSKEYDGQVFPPYLYDTDVLFIARAEYGGKTEYLYMPCEREAIRACVHRRFKREEA